MKQIIRKISLFAMSMFVAVMAFAQVTTSSMSGKVADNSGIPVAGATVIAVHTPSGTQYYAIADGSGNFRIMNIRPGGPYTVTVEMLGYQKVEITGVNVALADNYVLNSVLKEETMSLEEVVISAESATSNMRSDRAGAITTIDKNIMNSLPSISRSMEDFVKLTPQAYNSGSNGPQIAGGTYRQNFFTIDGAAANNAFGIGQSMPASGSPISMDAIEQISISVTPYDVRQSGFLGGSLNAVTRSGGNKFEASAYTYYYNEKFRGSKIGDDELTLNEESHLVYGVRVGGPIIKNKLFFFASAEIEDITSPGPSKRAATPEKPFTDGSDGIARPTEAQLDIISKYLKDNYGYDTGAYQGYSTKRPGLKLLARIDWNINRDHKFNIRYSNTKTKAPNSPSTSTSGLPDRNHLQGTRQDINSIFFQNARYYQEQNYSSVAAELTSRFLEGRLNNVLRATYSHQYEPRSYDGSYLPFVDILEEGKYYTSFGNELFSFGNLRDVNTVSVTDEVSYSIGKHNLFAGVQYEWNRTKNGFQRFGAGYFQYDSWEDFVNDNPYQFAITHSLRDDYSQAFPTFDFSQFSFYLQDEMNLSDNFKLLAGLRIELPIYPELPYDRSEQVFETQLAEHNGNGGFYNTKQLPSTKVMFSPRIGFNWDIAGNRKYVLRGGSGFFTGRLPFVWIVAQAGDSGVIQTTYTAKAGEAGKVIPAFGTDRQKMLEEIYGTGSPTLLPVSSVSLMADDLKMPQTWKSSLAFDVKLPGDVLFSLEGIYNYDINPTTITNVGLKDPVMSNIPGFADNRYVYSKHSNTLRDAYLLENSKVKGYYYSVTAKLEKNNWKGFNGMVAYTYSGGKSLNDGWGDQMYSAFQSASTVNGSNLEILGNPAYVMPHHLIASLGYKIDYARHFATAINLFYEGGPANRYSYTYTGNVVGDGGGNNLIYVPRTKEELTFSKYTYKNAAGETVEYTPEDQATDFWNFIENNPYLKTRKGMYAERNALIAPWTHQFDLRITQDFYLDMKNGQRNTLQVGLDIRNLGNLLNKNWGHKYATTTTALLKLASNGYKQGGDTPGAVPVYQFQRNGTEVLTEPFRTTFGTSSTYLMQISVRYIFQ